MVKRKRKLKKVAKRLVKVHKREGYHEKFDASKVEKSCYKAGRATQLNREAARKLARKCVVEVRTELRKHDHIGSRELRNLIIKTLQKYNKEVALMYRAIKELG